MEIKGRQPYFFHGVSNFIGTITGGRIRIDDSIHPDFWVEIELSEEDIIALLPEHIQELIINHTGDEDGDH